MAELTPMINHAFSTLYNLAAATAVGVYVPSGLPLVVPDVIAAGIAGSRGSTQASAEAFAIQGVKVIDASTLRTELTAEDSRVTFTTAEIGAAVTDSLEFVQDLAGAPGSLLAAALLDADLKAVFTSPIPQERAAAVLVGVIRRITEANG